LTEINVNTKKPTSVPAEMLMPNATASLFDFMVTSNVNVNNLKLWSQQWTETVYTDEANYDLVTRNSNGRAWNTLYASVIRDLKEAKKAIALDAALTDAGRKAQTATCDVMEVYAFHVLVDLFGNVPYSEAMLEGTESPAYDDAATIYEDLLARLATASNNLVGDNGFGTADLIYGGDAAKWKKFANSLRLRLAIRLADSDAVAAKTAAEAAIAAGVFTSSSDNFTLNYLDAPPNTNPIWEDLVQSGRNDFVAANTLTDYLNGLDDPRRFMFFEAPFDGNGNPIGGTYGASSSYGTYSHVNSTITNPTMPGTIMSYSEVEFLLADAAERGYTGTGTATSHYSAGVESSILQWGGSAADVTTYLAQPNVAYATVVGTWKEKIAIQKWIALYNQGFEAYSTYRLYDAPTMNVAAGVNLLPPTRFTYPTTEYSLNGTNVKAAASTIGEDLPTTKIFWDKN
jgi:hypothetical protein